MYLLKTTTVALALICLSGCRQQQETNTDPATTAQSATAPLKFDIKTVMRSSGDCGPDSSICAKVTIVYPEAVAGPDKLRQSINRYVQQRLQSIKLDLNPDADTTATGNAASDLADFFLKQRQQFVEAMKTMPDTPAAITGWEMQVKGKPLYVSEKVVSLRFDIYHFSGGAHGNPSNILQSFDSTGHTLTLTEMVSDTAQLRKLTEQKFRQVRKEVVGNKTLSEAGYFVKGDTLPLPQNYALSPDGLLLYYNPYEIGPYVMGDTELLLPYAQLQDLLKPAYRP